MKTIPTFAAIIVVFFFALAFPSLAEPVFPKGAEVRLTKEAPLLFKSEETRVGKAGERFTVIQHDANAKRVFVLATDAAGKQVALNVAEDAVEFAPFDVANLRTTLLALIEKTDFVNATAIVESAAAKAPNDTRLQECRTSVLAAKTAHDKIIAAAKNAENAKARVAQLSKSAWAARNNFLDANGGFARSQEMKAEADKLIADSNTETAQAKTEWDSAKENLSSVLNRLVPNSPSAAAATSGLAGNDAHNTGPQDQSSPQHINLLQNLKSAAKEICSPIREQYVAALKKLADSFQQAGDFANLTIVRTEIEEIQRLDGLSKAFGERRFTGDIGRQNDIFGKQFQTTTSEINDIAIELCGKTVKSLTIAGKLDEATALAQEMKHIQHIKEFDTSRLSPDVPQTVIGRGKFDGSYLHIASANGDSLIVNLNGRQIPILTGETDYALRCQVRLAAYPILASKLFVPSKRLADVQTPVAQNPPENGGAEASRRLGETKEETEERYGPPVQSRDPSPYLMQLFTYLKITPFDPLPRIEGYTYVKENWTIAVIYLDGKSAAEMYYAGGSTSFKDDEVVHLLKINAGDKVWQRIKRIVDTQYYLEWRLVGPHDEGQKQQYTIAILNGSSLTITLPAIPDYIKEVRENAVKEAAERKAKALKGL